VELIVHGKPNRRMRKNLRGRIRRLKKARELLHPEAQRMSDDAIYDFDFPSLGSNPLLRGLEEAYDVFRELAETEAKLARANRLLRDYDPDCIGASGDDGR